MASRQKALAEDLQQPPGDEETVSGTGEGDEIMEAEEQEDGYSEPFSHPHRRWQVVAGRLQPCYTPSPRLLRH